MFVVGRVTGGEGGVKNRPRTIAALFSPCYQTIGQPGWKVTDLREREVKSGTIATRIEIVWINSQGKEREVQVGKVNE